MDNGGKTLDLAGITQHAVQFSRALLNAGGEDSELSQLTIVQLRLIHAIEVSDQLKMHELAERLNLKVPTLSHMAERLVRLGLLLKKPDSTDRRIMRLALTEHACALLQERAVGRQAYMRTILDSMFEDRRRIIEQCLHDLSTAVSNSQLPSTQSAGQAWIDQASSQELAQCP